MGREPTTRAWRGASRRAFGTAAWALACVLGACAGPGVGPDASAGDAGVGALAIGEGERAFRAIEDGDTLLLARGCQGSQHVWITLRSEGMDPRGMVVQLSMARVRDATPITADFRLRLSFVPEDAGTAAQLTGLTLQVPMPESAIGEDLLLRGRIEDRVGRVASEERAVRIAWGPEVCGG